MAGATYLVSKESLDSGKYKWDEVIGPPAVSVTTRQIFNDISSDVIIIKIDVEGHECKVFYELIHLTISIRIHNFPISTPVQHKNVEGYNTLQWRRPQSCRSQYAAFANTQLLKVPVLFPL